MNLCLLRAWLVFYLYFNFFLLLYSFAWYHSPGTILDVFIGYLFFPDPVGRVVSIIIITHRES